MKESTIRPSVAIGLCILFGGAFAFIVIAIISGMIGGFDRSVIDAIQGLEAPWLTSIMHSFHLHRLHENRHAYYHCSDHPSIMEVRRQKPSLFLFLHDDWDNHHRSNH